MLWSVRASLVLLFTAATLVVSAADFWKIKQPSEWSEKEVKRLLTNSPWAKEVVVQMGGVMPATATSGGGRGGGRRGGAMGPMGGGVGGSGVPSADMGGASGPGQGEMGGGMGNSGSASPSSAPTVIVRWETAAPVREAARTAELPYAARMLEWEKQFYVITTSGLPFGGRQQPDPDRVRQMQERLRGSATLRAKGKPPVGPERVFLANAARGSTMIFLFPRSAAFTVEDKDVTFETAAGPMQIKAKFKPREMEYQGKLAL
jgi:hypothetical protein